MPDILKINDPIKVQYCIETWLRNEQVRQATARIHARIEEGPLRDEPCAVVCYGPSLVDTWEKVREFRYIFSCSGSHKFLRERGITPTWHVEVDPRAHKVELIGEPHPDVEYLIASACHQKVFDHLEGYNVKLWHVFAPHPNDWREQPRGEWALTGGSSVGLRVLTIARFLGFRELHVFGMDGCEGATGKHAAAHPNQPKSHVLVEYPEGSGTMYRTTHSILACAKETFHELDMLKDVKATFYGEGLVQEMAKQYVPNPSPKPAFLGFTKPVLISEEYKRLNAQLHHDNLAYGVGGGKHAPTVIKLAERMQTRSILDYGCGKGYLAKEIPFPIWEYDPAVLGKDQEPRPADLVVCTDVLEHIEPERLQFVLNDLASLVLKIGYFVIHTGPAAKKLADGRNTHLIQQGEAYWRTKLSRHFTIGQIWNLGHELRVVVRPRPAVLKKKKAMVMADTAK